MSETEQHVENSTESLEKTEHVENSTESLEKIEDTFMKIKVNEKEMGQSRPYLGKEDCQLFLRTGQCRYGNSCRYTHPLTSFPQGVPYYYIDQLPERIGEPDCEFFVKKGGCKYGPRCIYHHPKDRNGAGPVLFNALGYPMRQDEEKSCPYYMKTGLCRFGVACKFHHPEPSKAHSAAYPLSSFPSLSYPYTGGMVMMPLLVPPTYYPTYYGAMSYPQVPTYIPFMVAPSQTFLPPQSWPASNMPHPHPIVSTTVSISSPPPKSEDSSPRTPSPKSEEEDSSPRSSSDDHPSSENEKILPSPKSEEENASPRSGCDHPSSENEIPRSGSDHPSSENEKQADEQFSTCGSQLTSMPEICCN